MALVTMHGKREPHPAACLLIILQRHGLTLEALEAWVHFLEAKKTGSVAFHSKDGRLELYEEHGYTAISKPVSQ